MEELQSICKKLKKKKTLTEPNNGNKRDGREQGWAEVVQQEAADGECQT